MTFDELDIDRVMQTFAPRPKLTPEQIKLRQERMAQLKISRSDVPTKYFEVEKASEATKIQVMLNKLHLCQIWLQ